MVIVCLSEKLMAGLFSRGCSITDWSKFPMIPEFRGTLKFFWPLCKLLQLTLASMEEMLSIKCLIPRELNYFLKSLLLRTQAIRKTKKHLLTEDGESDIRGYSHILATVCAVGYDGASFCPCCHCVPSVILIRYVVPELLKKEKENASAQMPLGLNKKQINICFGA